jgi:membrane-associated phospholipid phosphatase
VTVKGVVRPATSWWLAVLLVLLAASPSYAQDTPQPTLQMPSLRSVFSDLGSDVRQLATIENGAWLAGTGALAFAVHENDGLITQEAAGSARLEGFLDSGSPMGNGLLQGGGALGTYIIGRVTHRAAVAVVGSELLRAQVINAVLTQGIKTVADRERPDGGRHSFPSGHTSAAFTSATVLFRRFGWKAGAPGYALATYVAGSRLSENAHFLSDVIFGAGVGIVSGRTVTIGHGRPFAIAPATGSGAIGVAVTRIERP